MSSYLSKLPKDILINCIMPMIAQPPLDDWAQRLFKWTSPRFHISMFELDEYCNNGLLVHTEQWATELVAAMPLSAFTIFSNDIIPFSIHKQLHGRGSDETLVLVREIHHSALSHRTWRDADAIGSHLLNSVAIAVQRCTGMALRESLEKEVERVYGPQVA